MKFIAAMGAGLLAVTGFAATATAADAQGRGWHDDRGWRGDRWDRGPGWDRGRGYDRGWRGDRWDRGPGWRGDRGYGYGYGYRAPRFRTVCRIERGYYGPVRQCYQVRR